MSYFDYFFRCLFSICTSVSSEFPQKKNVKLFRSHHSLNNIWSLPWLLSTLFINLQWFEFFSTKGFQRKTCENVLFTSLHWLASTEWLKSELRLTGVLCKGALGLSNQQWDYWDLIEKLSRYCQTQTESLNDFCVNNVAR